MSSNRRSIVIDGRVTSILLEPAFWRYLDEIARDRGCSWSRYVRQVLHELGDVPNRAAAIKQYLLQRALHENSPASEKLSKAISVRWEWRSGGHKGVFSSEQTLVTIGRVATCDIVLDDDECSRVHAALFRAAGSWWVTDLDSKNGVWIKGERIQSHRLGPRNWVEMGKSRIRLAD